MHHGRKSDALQCEVGVGPTLESARKWDARPDGKADARDGSHDDESSGESADLGPLDPVDNFEVLHDSFIFAHSLAKVSGW